MNATLAAKPVIESRRERKKRAQKQEIYQAGTALFMAKGFENTTIDMIAELADIGRATFFNYYPTKADILHEIAASAVDHAKRVFDKEFDDGPGPVTDKIKRCFTRFALIVERNPEYYQTVFLDVMRTLTGFVDAGSAARPNLIKVLSVHLEAEQKKGELDPALDPGQMSEMLTGIYNYTILNCGMHDFSYSLVGRLTKAAEIFIEGCAPPELKKKSGD
jgi:AcrR family transcriptional regulator